MRPQMAPRQLTLWKRLTKPVGKRGSWSNNMPHGVALLTVMVGLAIMSAVVTDLGYNEMVRYKLAIHERDAVKAEALAQSGLNISRLLLVAQGAIQPMLTKLASARIPLPAHTLWQLIPLESELFKGVSSGALQSTFGLDVSDSLEKRGEAMKEIREEMLEQFDDEAVGAGDGPFEPPEGGFGAFDGSFSVDIKDEESKITLRGWDQQMTPQSRFAYAARLYSIFQPEQYDFLFEERDAWGNRVDRWELIANIYDYLDANEDATDGNADPIQWGRLTVGSEEGNYTSYDNLEPKNAYFDSLQELRLVHGFSDEHMKAFGEDITIYGEGKVNLLSASTRSLEMLIRLCAMDLTEPSLQDPMWMEETLSLWHEYRTLGPAEGGGPVAPKGSKSF